jgi:hypothetical protein
VQISDLHPSRRRLSDSGLVIVIVGAFLSYTHLELTPLKLFAYVMSLAGLSLMALAQAWVHRGPATVAGAFAAGITLATLVSALLSRTGAGAMSLVQDLFYPIVLFVGSVVLYRIRVAPVRVAKAVVLGIGLANFGVALLGSFGILGSVPLFGPIETGRWVFGTTVPSASGLAFNVNYMAVAQASLFFFYGIMAAEDHDRHDAGALWFLALSSLWGSSRGVLLALLIAVVVVTGIGARHDRTRRRARARSWLLVAALGVGVGVVMLGDYLYDAFRLYKGLNLRDQLWGHGLALWRERPVFGWGMDMKEGERFIGGALGAGSSLHSGYLHTLVRGGVALFVSSYGFIVFAVFWGLGTDRRRWLRHRWAVAAIVFYLVNTAFRTYSLGGTGLLPMLAVTGISICLHARFSGALAEPDDGMRPAEPRDGPTSSEATEP